MKTGIRWAFVGTCILTLATGAFATEGGGGAYPNGAEDFMTGALPPPGQYAITYGLYYKADDLMDGHGDALSIPFDLEVSGAILRLINVTPVKVAGGLWTQQIFVPALNVDVTTPGGSDSKFGIGDVIVDPTVLSWHKPPFHWAAGVDVYVPVGAYDKNDMANLGRNCWTFEPVLAGTYLSEQGVELSAKLMYDVNTQNDDTDYQSGDEFHMDAAAGVPVGKFKVGVNGFMYRQVTGDDVPEGGQDAGFGQQFGLGPVVSLQYKKVSLIAKQQTEFGTENRPEGDRFWLKAVCPF